MNNNFQVKEMTESMPRLKSSRANYIFISDNGVIKRNGYFFKERIQFIFMKWPVNIETYLKFFDYCKFWAHPFTYFILTLLNSKPESKFCQPTRLFVQAYITSCSLKFKLEMMNIMLQMMNIITKYYKRKSKKFSVIFSRNISGRERT